MASIRICAWRWACLLFAVLDVEFPGLASDVFTADGSSAMCSESGILDSSLFFGIIRSPCDDMYRVNSSRVTLHCSQIYCTMCSVSRSISPPNSIARSYTRRLLTGKRSSILLLMAKTNLSSCDDRS
eukprot:11794_4